MTAPVWYGVYAAAAMLLAVGGVMKLARPHSTTRALRSVDLPASALAVRIGSAVECAVAVLALAAGGPRPAAAVGASYLAFAAFIVVAHRRGGSVSSCGCFGETDSPPTFLHLILDLGAAATAVLATRHHAPAIDQALRGNVAHAALLAALTLTLAYVGYLGMAVLPKTMAAETTK
jgi:uncharacterized membrane protein YphA (DoxX/SURF4 family)